MLTRPLFTHLTGSSYFIRSYTTGKRTLTKVSILVSDVAWQVFSSYTSTIPLNAEVWGLARIGAGRWSTKSCCYPSLVSCWLTGNCGSTVGWLCMRVHVCVEWGMIINVGCFYGPFKRIFHFRHMHLNNAQQSDLDIYMHTIEAKEGK